MRIAITMLTGLTAAGLLAGCATAPTVLPVEVTRYRVDDVGRGTIAITVAPNSDLGPVQFDLYANAIAEQLGRLGYTVLPASKNGDATVTPNAAYVATVDIDTDSRIARSRSPVSIGLGGGGFTGGGVGLGGGVSFPIGRGRARQDVATVLSVKINTRDGQGVWEGRATSREIRPEGTGDANANAARLASALFTGFPGESGRTIEVK